MRKFLITMMCIIMVVCFMPTVAMAETENSEAVINVNPKNVQNYLDGEYGPIDGKTIILSAGTYGKLELGRATKYPGSNTDYYIGGIAEGNKKTYEQFVKIKTDSTWSAPAYYVRNMSNVTIKAAEGANVEVAGLIASSGHVYGNVYDYVLDKKYTSGSAYYLSQNLKNITIEGITFTAKAEFATSSSDTVIDGVTFKNCNFNIGNTASGNQALRYYNENDNGNVKNLTVENCAFNNCFQGVYTQKINGIKVTDSTFDTTGHNAIAVQSGSDAVNHKSVVITGNTFSNIRDRIIRFGSVAADTQITIKNNTATNSGDSNGEVMKAQSLAERVTYDICGNNWGDGKNVANEELKDKDAVAAINGLKYTSLQDAIAAATEGQTVTLLNDVTDGDGVIVQSGKNVIIDFARHTYTVTQNLAGSSGTETQCFQLLKDSTIKMKNGTIRGNNENVKMLIQNYSNLTLEDMTLDTKEGTNDVLYTLSNNNGNINIVGNTSINAPVGKIAFDVCWNKANYADGAKVTVNTTGTIEGNVELGLWNTSEPYDNSPSNLLIKNGVFTGAFKVNENLDGKKLITITGGTFSTDPKEYVASGYTVTGSGPFTVKAISSGVPSLPPIPTDNVTNSGSTAADNASTNADLSGSTSTSNGTTSATVDKTTADKIVDKAVENKSTEVVIDATANTTTAADSTTIAQVTIPTETLGAIAEKTEADVTIKTDVAEVKMDNAAAAAVSEQAEGDTVQIIAEKVAEETDKVEFELKVVCSDGKVISNFNGGNIAVTVALPKAMAEKKVVCVYIDDNGHMSKVEGQKNADGTYTFVTGHFSSYAILAEEEADAAIAAQKEAIKNIKIKLTSKQVKTKAGKKAVKITWTADAGDKVLDGVEVFRSTERYKGYGTEPFYTSTKGGNTGSYTNTKSLKKGTKYYYRVRGYVLVDGQKVYTDYSTKAWRTVK